MTSDQHDYFEAITGYMEEYENVAEPVLSGMEVLRHLMEANGLRGVDLAEIIGGDVSLASRILRGQRRITAEHARSLGKRFKLDPGIFIAE